MKEWIQTDPATKQYGRQLGDAIYEFKEYGEDSDDFKTTIIDLDEYTEMDIYEYMLPYYTRGEIDRMLTGCEDEDGWLIAETIFEQLNLD